MQPPHLESVLLDPAAAAAVRAVSRRRWIVAASLTAMMVFIYFGFVGLVAYRPELLATVLAEGLTLGIVLGALVIVAAWLLTLTYVWWANRHYDPALAKLRTARRERA